MWIFLRLGEFVLSVTNSLGSCVALSKVFVVGVVAVGTSRDCLAVFSVVLGVADAAGSARLRRRALHGRVELPAVLALHESLELCYEERVRS